MSTVGDWRPGYRTCPACGDQTPCGCCVLWTGSKHRDGYGAAAWGPTRADGRGRQVVGVHRWTYEQAHGPVPAGMVVMHICDTPACYFLGHLRAGTVGDNLADAYAKGVIMPMNPRLADDEPCGRGHDPTESYRRPSTGFRECRACRRERKRAAKN